MIGTILSRARLDPTLIVGGIVKHLDTGAVLGKGKYLVAEADEFDRSFLSMDPTVAVITTLEADHLDCYSSVDEIKEAFINFANRVPFFGMVVVCLDETSIQEIIPSLEKSVITYGFSSQADYKILKRSSFVFGSEFSVGYQNKKLGTIRLNLPGRHNVNNGLAAVAVGLELGIPFNTIKRGLESFKGVRRRFEIKGRVRGITLVDEFAHHPTEIRASLEGAREATKGRIVVIFQPHLYSRTRDFHLEFGRSFFDCDLLIIMDIYPAREKPIPGVTGEMIARAAEASGHRHVEYIPKAADVEKFLFRTLKTGDMMITVGAGDVWKISERVQKRLKSSRGK
jgi:UDP-N-acetylmuramate--alanine ligase